MKEVKKFIEEKLEMEVMEYSYNDTDYLLTPMFAVIKRNEEYLISFSIDVSKKIAFNFYIEFGQYFLGEINFVVYEDCIIKVDFFTNKLEYFYFGNEAKQIYFNEICQDIKTQNSIPKDVTFH